MPSTSTPYTGGANNCFLNQPIRWWYIPTLEVQPYTGGTSRLLSKSNPYAGGTNSCIQPPLRCRYKQLLSKSTHYSGGTNSCFLNQPLRWWYINIPTLEVQPYTGGTDATDQSVLSPQPQTVHSSPVLTTTAVHPFIAMERIANFVLQTCSVTEMLVICYYQTRSVTEMLVASSSTLQYMVH